MTSKIIHFQLVGSRAKIFSSHVYKRTAVPAPLALGGHHDFYIIEEIGSAKFSSSDASEFAVDIIFLIHNSISSPRLIMWLIPHKSSHSQFSLYLGSRDLPQATSLDTRAAATELLDSVLITMK